MISKECDIRDGGNPAENGQRDHGHTGAMKLGADISDDGRAGGPTEVANGVDERNTGCGGSAG